MLSGEEGMTHPDTGSTDSGAPVILTTPPLVKNPSEQAIISKNLESLDLASTTTTRDYSQALTKILSVPGNKSSEDKKSGKVKSMFIGRLSPFKVKSDQPPSSPIPPRAPSPTPSSSSSAAEHTETVARNKKDCSVTVKGNIT